MDNGAETSPGKGPEISHDRSDKTDSRNPAQPPLTSSAGKMPHSDVPFPNFDNPADLLGGDPAKILKEGASARVEEAIRDQSELSEGERLTPAEKLKKMDPSMPDVMAKGLGSIVDLTQGKETIDDSVKDQMIQKFQTIQIPQEDARALLDNTTALSDQQKDEIVSKLKPRSESPQQAEPTPDEQKQMTATGEVAQEHLMKMNDIVDKTPAKDEKSKKQQSELKKKIAKLSERFNVFMHPDDPLRTWAARGGKTLFYVLLTAFIVLSAEMSLIHRMASKK
ncbi:MAG TPA: hypothetical protein VLF93_03570 [Candidatus Saccharimonadales bacterium]|nr:hypothetical protein [Candidatus Saccharimonadales bacterium]